MNYPLWLLVAFSLFWLILAIRPYDRVVWLTENALTIFTIGALTATHSLWPVSNLSYSLVVAFLVLHTIGGHYTYVRVPYDTVFKAVFGFALSERQRRP